MPKDDPPAVAACGSVFSPVAVPVITLLQHDNAHTHVSVPAATQRPVWPWPVNSPRLNPMKDL